MALSASRVYLSGLAGGKITLGEVHALAYLLAHGRWPDAETAAWAEGRVSQVALDYLLSARLRGTIAAFHPDGDEEAAQREQALAAYQQRPVAVRRYARAVLRRRQRGH
jgi:hypothetical protein